MTIFGVFNLLVVLLAALNITGAADSDVMAAMSKVFSSATGSGTSDSKSYFISHGKAMFHQASMLDFMTLAKLGRAREACDQLASQVIQTILADLPLRYQAVGDLMSLMQSDRSFFTKTMIAVQTNMKTVSKDIKDKLIAFMKTKKTNADKLRIRTEIENSIKDQDEARKKIFSAWKEDLTGLKTLSEASNPTARELRSLLVYGKVKYYVKRLQFGRTKSEIHQNLKFIRPVADTLGIIVSGIGLVDAIITKNTVGIINNVLGIVGSVVGLSLFTASLTASAVAKVVLVAVSGLVGTAFFIIPLTVLAFWPTNLAVETANKLTKVSQKDLEDYFQHLGSFTGSHSFGWIYQVNSGVLVQNKIKPDTPVKFWHPSCTVSSATPCHAKTANYMYKPDPKKEGKQIRYLVLGQQRQSFYKRQWKTFELVIPYDFLGFPTQSKFCGNTISVNTAFFRRYINDLGRKYPRTLGELVGRFQRNVEIDTTTLPQYQNVDLGQFPSKKKEKTSKRQQTPIQLDETTENKCELASDRISFDELAKLHPRTGKVTIKSGAGKDVLSIGSMIGGMPNMYSKTDYLVADLGEDGNMLSMGAALGFDPTPESVVAGVVFDNTAGAGQVCFLKEDLTNKKCVGTVKKVAIFKGSRLHDTVIMGAKGPFTVIQNSGANEYIIDVPDILAGWPAAVPKGPSVAVPEPVAFYPLDKQFTTNDVKKRPQLKGKPSEDVAVTSGLYNALDGAYEFAGNINSYIEFPNGDGILDVKHSITLMCWVRPGGQDGPLFNYKKSGEWGVHIWIVNGKIFNRITKSYRHEHREAISTDKPLEVGKWVHVAATYDHKTGVNIIYVDGKMSKAQNIGTGFEISTNDPEVRMGVKDGDDRYFKGAITQMRVYDVALSKQQILAVRNQATPSPTRFDVMDISGNCPLLKIRQSRGNRVTPEVKENKTIKLKRSDGEVVVEIRVTGYTTTKIDIQDE